jgi:hypothetical protein
LLPNAIEDAVRDEAEGFRPGPAVDIQAELNLVLRPIRLFGLLMKSPDEPYGRLVKEIRQLEHVRLPFVVRRCAAGCAPAQTWRGPGCLRQASRTKRPVS